ncbi:unnamed protein product [Didymodactylos carnosus]|uniref:N-acetyltransferase domain-containing protein n=1 Tax=Didymodactylos carnosus TaxID=1234261 RepID=A0A814H5X1_9BILA|nr:unnamed protein product [Didymodactylos carnosus]CAF1006293.1 unnamed protein product [Didymodactylos carnosus]CAF3766764.1 unnamed protein product [Didymodactylos carnosus]CAF3777552.1 unnamed protein product [Didymodactylos carnosus]
MLSRAINNSTLFKRTPTSDSELRRMAVISKYQKQRIGFRLLQTLIEFSRSNGYRAIPLATSSGMKLACAFYERCGFTKGKVQKFEMNIASNEPINIFDSKPTVFEDSSDLTEEDIRLINLPMSKSHYFYIHHYWMVI